MHNVSGEHSITRYVVIAVFLIAIAVSMITT